MNKPRGIRHEFADGPPAAVTLKPGPRAAIDQAARAAGGPSEAGSSDRARAHLAEPSRSPAAAATRAASRRAIFQGSRLGRVRC